jgi:hypothetical protein
MFEKGNGSTYWREDGLYLHGMAQLVAHLEENKLKLIVHYIQV